MSKIVVVRGSKTLEEARIRVEDAATVLTYMKTALYAVTALSIGVLTGLALRVLA